MPANCDDCQHRGPNECYRGRDLFPPKCGWFIEASAKREQEDEWKREWEAEEEEVEPDERVPLPLAF